MSTLLGIDIGGTAVKIGVVDENGNILLSDTRSVSFDGYKTPIMTTVIGLAREIMARCEEKPVGIGVSATGQIDVHTGTVIGVGAHFGNWLGSNIKEMLEAEFSLPVTVINDANAAALGEQCFGRAKGKENALVVTIGTGVGGGIIENGRLIQGKRGIGGEIGHYIIDFDGEPCPCGSRGCFERYTSATALIYFGKEAVAKGEKTSLFDACEGDPRKITAKMVIDAAKEGDEVCAAIFHRLSPLTTV